MILKVAKVLLKVVSAIIATVFYIAEEHSDSAQAGLTGMKVMGGWEDVEMTDSIDEIQNKLL